MPHKSGDGVVCGRGDEEKKGNDKGGSFRRHMCNDTQYAAAVDFPLLKLYHIVEIAKWVVPRGLCQFS